MIHQKRSSLLAVTVSFPKQWSKSKCLSSCVCHSWSSFNYSSVSIYYIQVCFITSIHSEGETELPFVHLASQTSTNHKRDSIRFFFWGWRNSNTTFNFTSCKNVDKCTYKLSSYKHPWFHSLHIICICNPTLTENITGPWSSDACHHAPLPLLHFTSVFVW